jgi:CSLREA domain-containing protein
VAIGGGALLAVLACLLVARAILASPASADFAVVVTTTADETTAGNGTCSLREAVLYANGTAESDCGPTGQTGITTINLPAGHYVVTSPLTITGAAVIDGAGASSTIIDGNGAVEVFSVGAAAQATLNGLAVTGGSSGDAFCGLVCFAVGNPGGGINNAGQLSLVHVTVSNNVASGGAIQCFFFFFFSCPTGTAQPGGAGGGIYNTGNLIISGSTITGNKTGGGEAGSGGGGGSSGAGGGVDNTATMTVTNSTISGNSTGPGGTGSNGADGASAGDAGGAGSAGAPAGSGGGIENTGSQLNITNSTINGNSTGRGGAGGNGGTGNGTGVGGNAGAGAAGGGGGGIDSGSAITIENSTITGNATGGGGAQGSPGAGTPAGTTAAPGAAGAGGALNQSSAGATLVQDTIADNTSAGSGGGLNTTAGGSITYGSSIIASNHGASAASNCSLGGMFTSTGHSIAFGDNTCQAQGIDPQLGSLTDNGGPTATMAIPPGSSAIDVVPDNDCPLTSDQRGVARPQRGACDAGAYELAPPSLGPALASASTTSSGIVTTSINPNLKDTHVSVVYGTTTAYGSASSTQDLGAGNSPSAYSATLGGLKPNTTYHAQVIAGNADGTTTSGDLSFTTPASVATVIGKASISGQVLSLAIDCKHGDATDVCTGPVALTTHETTQAGSPVAVAAAQKKPTKPKKKPKKGPPKKTTTVILAKTSYSVKTGNSVTLKLALNAAGKKLLNHFYRLPATLSVGGTSSLTRSVTFSFGRLHISPAFTWAFGKSFSFATELTVSGLPKKSKVALICHGHGCPFSKRTFSAPKHGKLLLAPALKQRHLSPHATVELDITAPNDVGEVVVFTIVSGKQPTEAFRCLVPGARTPTACAS